MAPYSTYTEPASIIPNEALCMVMTGGVVSGAVVVIVGVSVTILEGKPVPAALSAKTRNWYRCPLVNPVTVTVGGSVMGGGAII